MALLPKVLAAGTSPDTATTVYTAPVSGYAIIKSVIAHNGLAGTETITVEIRKSGSDYTILSVDVEAGAQLFLSETIVLDASDQIRITASTNNAFDYWISGVEEDSI